MEERGARELFRGAVVSLRFPRGNERVRGIEPPYAAWEAAVLPLNYTRERKLGVYS